jgi:hypothetical protein
VPLVWKLTDTSVPACTLPVPETVDWTTPSCAVTSSREVRAELVGGPICVMAKATTAAVSTASRYRGHGRARPSRRLSMPSL